MSSVNINGTLKIPIESFFRGERKEVDKEALYSFLKISGDFWNIRRVDISKDSFQENIPNVLVKVFFLNA